MIIVKFTCDYCGKDINAKVTDYETFKMPDGWSSRYRKERRERQDACSLVCVAKLNEKTGASAILTFDVLEGKIISGVEDE
jgi:hypothetical protein